ncbi:uncharacterized protein BJ212DRAFT_1360336 [Suillus subaureus]|uniref:Uncharacterized protein n=1 Tax=Suillus subaureus TaxID=48587 RepID=A0A9P7JD13_9AGAM|nr:uncharacterized protein BJ212DRAFT_1360336 [Suillus subaureus]KAG1815217.1 hypothetical protein BJ212DRAFT_1360336 [Suillus subaureus]
MRAGRLNSTLRSNYRLFHEFLCDKKVPIVVVITHLEGEVREMDDWWKRNEDSFRRCGIHVAGHACITAIKDNYEKQYEESRTTIRKLVKDFAADGQNLACAPWNDPNGGDNLDWFVSFTCKLKGLLKGNWKLHAKKDVVPRLERCGMSRDIAKQLARRIKNVVVEGTT